MKVFSGQSAIETDNSAVSHETTCGLTMDQAPVVNDLHLGMTAEEVTALFPGSKGDAELRSSLSATSKFGTSGFMIRPANYETKDKYAGISQITFALLDGRVSKFYVGYNGPEYSHVDKFVARFTEGTNLPSADQWEVYVGLDTQLKTLTCKDFEVSVFAGGKGGNLNYVQMTDLEAGKKLKDRKAKARAKAKPETKPPV
jgi:hypothetical protein